MPLPISSMHWLDLEAEVNVIEGSETFVGRLGTNENPSYAQSSIYRGLSLVPRNSELPVISNPNGILLTTGSADIPLENTRFDFTERTGTGEDDDLKQILEDSGGPVVPVSDVNILEFSFTVPEGFTTVEADFVFGSEEFPDQAVTDVVGFFVDGQNYASFPDGSLVSFVRDGNEENFNSNDSDDYLLEYDGISNSLRIVGLLDPNIPAGEPHHLKIAIGDTGLNSMQPDVQFDSGIFIANLVAGTSTEATSGVSRSPNITRNFEFDPRFSQLTETVDELGRRVIYEIDPNTGNRLSMTQVVGEIDTPQNGENDDLVTRMTYGNFGLLATSTDPLGRITEYSYNEIGLMTSVIVAQGTTDEATTTYDYDAAGNRILMVDGEGNETRYEYDSLNRLTKTIEQDPDGNGPLQSPVSEISYDAFGNVSTITDANGNTTTNFYDELNRLIQTDSPDPDGNGPRRSPVTRYFYDPFGNLEQSVDPSGHITSYEYDSRNRRVSMTDPDGGVTRFEYDFDDNLVALTDPVGNRTTFDYDARDRLFAETDPFGNKIEYSYDLVDNLIQKTDRNGRVTLFEYDDIDRVISEEWLDENNATVNTIEYGYDKNSNLISLFDNQSSLAYTYDFRDRVESVSNAGTEGLPNVVLTYTYDDVSNVLSVSDVINGTTGATTGYQYDGLNRLTTLTQAGNETSDKRVDFTYNELGQYTAIDRYSDLAGTQLVIGTDYVYDGQNRLTRLDHQNSSGDSVAFYDYVYDTESRIRSITDVDGVTEYRYDNRDQLTGADYSDSVRPDESYEYDANGNRVESHLHGNGYETDLANRLISDGTYSYEYDDEGNMTRRTVEVESDDSGPVGSYRLFEWDHRNRLIAVTDFSPGDVITQSVEYRYDAIDRRIEKDVDGFATQFVYDREDVILDFAESDTDGTDEVRVVERYLHGGNVDQVLSQENSRGSEWLLTDHLGTIRQVSNSNGIVINQIVYDSYGKLLAESNDSFPTRYLFTSREFDRDVQMQYSRARYYEATIGRFISQDPIRFEATDNNLYRYVGNTPANFIDPSGLVAWHGAIQTDGLVAGVGGLTVRFNLTSECVDGLLCEVEGIAILPAIGAGASALPLSASTSSITMQDNRHTVDPLVFEGIAAISTFGFGFGVFGFNFSIGGTILRLGDARSTGEIGSFSGVDFSASLGLGSAIITSQSCFRCNCQ